MEKTVNLIILKIVNEHNEPINNVKILKILKNKYNLDVRKKYVNLVLHLLKTQNKINYVSRRYYCSKRLAKQKEVETPEDFGYNRRLRFVKSLGFCNVAEAIGEFGSHYNFNNAYKNWAQWQKQ